MFPPHFYDYCIVKGMFYDSDRWTKSIQHRVMRFSEHVYHYPTYEVLKISDDRDRLMMLADRLDQRLEIERRKEERERAKARKQAWNISIVDGKWVETPA
jgi:hypothetical protein